MNSSRRASMQACPNCEAMTSAVHECIQCEAKGCEDCILPEGPESLCTTCSDDDTDGEDTGEVDEN